MKKIKRIILNLLVLVMLVGTTPYVLTVNAASQNTAKTSVSQVASKAKGFKVSWKKKSGVKGYQIQYSTSSKFTKSTTKTKTVSGAKNTSATISKLNGCNKTYYVRIRTYKISKGKKVYSSWSSTKKATTLKHSYAAATCTEAKTCKYCGKTTGDELGHKWKAATCTKAKTCTRCEKTSGKKLGHKYAAATCTKAKTCTRCKKTSGKALGHKYASATCTKAKTCTRCKKTSGKALGHKYTAATCTTVKTCTRCAKTSGSELGHNYAAATCTKPATCSRCNKTSGKALGHKYAAATCTKAKTCSRCEKTSGSALGHKWSAATCTKAKTCSRCKKTTGKKLGHNYVNNTCTRCDAKEKVTLTVGIQPNMYVINYENNALTQWLEKECNVELDFVEFSGGTDVSTQISTMIAGRLPLPDILWGIQLGDVIRQRYGEEGYIIDLQDYFADKKGASKVFWNRLDTALSESERKNIVNAIKDPDTGSIYAVPTVESSCIDSMNYQTWINVEWLDKLGLDKPTNNTELLTVLRAFQSNDCNGNGEKYDEIPLLGSANAGAGSHIWDWLINLFVYYDSQSPYVVDKNGKLISVYTTDEYQEALKFIRQLYKEGLLSALTFTCSGAELKAMFTPSDGVATGGIVVGHLYSRAANNSSVLSQYEPLQTWGCAVMRSATCRLDTIISADCDNPDKAFEVLMAMWSEEGSYRIRYGEKDVHWDDATKGAKSVLGTDARFKLINDVALGTNKAIWGKTACTLLTDGNGETAEVVNQTNSQKLQMMASCFQLYSASAEKNNPAVVCPKLWATYTELEETEMERINVTNRAAKYRNNFILGTEDINDNTTWKKYLNTLKDDGLNAVVQQNQKIYDRQQ